jgi:hypothetical protein
MFVKLLFWSQLQGHCHEIFDHRFFFIHHPRLGPWLTGLAPFRIWLRIRRDISFDGRQIDAAEMAMTVRCDIWAVPLPLLKRFQRYNWDRWNDLSGVIYTADIRILSNISANTKPYAKRFQSADQGPRWGWFMKKSRDKSLVKVSLYKIGSRTAVMCKVGLAQWQTFLSE